jgi:transitional endoplasmic reticulum ATPase
MNTSQADIKLEALAALAKLGGQLTTEEDVVFQGKTFVVPETVSDLYEAAAILTNKADSEEEPTTFTRTFTYRPWDGAAALDRAIKRAFGFSIAKPGPWGSPPRMVSIPVGVGVKADVPQGNLALPGLKDTIATTSATRHPELGIVFQLHVTGPRKYRFIVEGLFNLVEEELALRSIYRGHPVDGADMPNFIDVSLVNPDDVVYTQEVMQQLEANVWSPIRHAEALEKLGQPGKRSVLFEGPYGTGKTLAAYLTAKVAEENGWTFIICRPGVDDLQQTLQTARMYQPSVVFFEDVDTVGNAEVMGDDAVTRILDTFDGLQTKGLKMLLVLTTNHVDRIHKGMIRPGRLDAIIHVGAMDRPGVERLVRRTVGANLADEIDFDAVFEAYDGFMPAFVKEAIDRTVRYSVARNDGLLGMVDTSDLVLAAQGLRRQLDLMNNASDARHTPTIDGTIKGLVQSTLQGSGIFRGDSSPDNGDEAWATIHVEVPDPASQN